MMSQQLQQWQSEIDAAQSIRDLDDLKVRLLGKTGEITSLLKTLGTLPPEERKDRGAEINQLKLVVSDHMDSRRSLLEEQELEARLASEKIDVT